MADVNPTRVEGWFAKYQTHGDADLMGAKQAAIDFTNAMLRGAGGYILSFLGPSGTGKTYLAKVINSAFKFAIEDKAIDPKLSGPGEIWRCKGGFVNWGASIGEMLNTGDYARMASYRADYFVALDDVAAEHSKLREISATKLFDILNPRLDRRWTVVTANCSLDEISERMDGRISSRLMRDGNICIQFPATMPDYALREI